MRDRIILYVYYSETIKRALNTINLPTCILKEDMFSHLITELMEMDESKLIKAYENGYLDRLCVAIITNNRTKTGRLYRTYNSNTGELGVIEDKNVIDIKEDLMPLLLEALNYYEGKRNDSFLEINYHLEILKMYYWEKMTYAQIATRTGIKSNRIRNSILKTKAFLKDYIKTKIENE